ncbi:hypothetical protein L195_g016785 [Trifolium pratense]|uniref:Uncharacterized protein n=1 Tax=Trifolium pratense TaxID=57577 RepID=A0A2K3MS38_TRIPR|nr:hypothetical protein L195_g016785 [Trifolium pratense]
MSGEVVIAKLKEGGRERKLVSCEREREVGREVERTVAVVREEEDGARTGGAALRPESE